MALRSDRPLRRALVKLASQVFLGSRRAHYHAWLPWLRIEGRTHDAPGEVLFRGRRLLSLLGTDALAARAGDVILIVGSGPSVKGQSLDGLAPRSALLLNGAISLIGDTVATPLAVAIEDERFVFRHFALMRSRIAADTLCLFSAGVLNAIAEFDPGWLEGRSVVLIDDIRKPYGAPRRSAAELQGLDFVRIDEEAGFSREPGRGVFQGGSVAVSALQFALATHAQSIGFLGVDISNANMPRFYEADGKSAFSGVAGAERRILAHIALAKSFAEAKGVRLINHSPVSALQSIGLDYRPLHTAA